MYTIRVAFVFVTSEQIPRHSWSYHLEEKGQRKKSHNSAVHVIKAECSVSAIVMRAICTTRSLMEKLEKQGR